MIGRLVSSWDGLFSGAVLVLWSVSHQFSKRCFLLQCFGCFLLQIICFFQGADPAQLLLQGAFVFFGNRWWGWRFFFAGFLGKKLPSLETNMSPEK